MIVVLQADAAQWALQPLLVGGAALWTNHRHGFTHLLDKEPPRTFDPALDPYLGQRSAVN
jgi:hypothetical protein